MFLRSLTVTDDTDFYSEARYDYDRHDWHFGDSVRLRLFRSPQGYKVVIVKFPSH